MEKLEKNKENILYPDIAQRMKKMVVEDQEMRKKAIKNPEQFDHEIDIRNTEEMKKIVDEIGWPTVSKVGVEGSANAWLLVQHTDHDVEFQRKCLTLMKQEDESEVSRHDIAYLEDRVLVNEEKEQLYGTQFIEGEEGFVPSPIKDVEEVDERRIGMGLNTLEENTRMMNERYQKE